MPTITLLERQKKHPERVNVYLDGEFAFGLNEMDAVQLKKGQVLTEADIAQLQNRDTLNKAVNKAIDLLSFRPRSTHEIRTALAKNYAPDVIDRAVEQLMTLGYLDDVAFARFWIDNRSTFKPLSSQALRYELKQKGVADSIIVDALAEIGDADAALRAAQSQLRKWRGRSRQDFKQQLGNFLQRRGFGYSVVNSTVKQVLMTLTEEDPDYFADES
jgi:regulatory protein